MLIGVGGVITVVGILFWLSGLYYSTVVIGLLGAIVGSFCGLLVAQWFEVHLLLSVVIGAAAFGIMSVLFKNPLTIVLATIVLGIVGGMVCLTLAVDSPAWRSTPEQEQPEFVHSFSNMDQSTRQVYLESNHQSRGWFL
jgi:hypothetical protein